MDSEHLVNRWRMITVFKWLFANMDTFNRIAALITEYSTGDITTAEFFKSLIDVLGPFIGGIFPPQLADLSVFSVEKLNAEEVSLKGSAVAMKIDWGLIQRIAIYICRLADLWAEFEVRKVA